MREATVERPAPKNRNPTIRVPKYGEDQLRAMLGLDDAAWSGNGAAPPDEDDLDATARAILRGEFGAA